MRAYSNNRCGGWSIVRRFCSQFGIALMCFVIGSKIVLDYLNQSKVKAKTISTCFRVLEPVGSAGIIETPVSHFSLLPSFDDRQQQFSCNALNTGSVCAISSSIGPIFEGRGGLFHVVWRTDLEVHLERTQNYCVELLALHLRRMII